MHFDIQSETTIANKLSVV